MCLFHPHPIAPTATFKILVSVLIALAANLVLQPAQSAAALPFPSPIESIMSVHDHPARNTPFSTALLPPFQPLAAPTLQAFAETKRELHVRTDKYTGIDFAQLSDDSLISLDYGPELASTDPSIVQSPNCPPSTGSIGDSALDSQEDEAEDVTNESLVLEAWQVVRDSFLDARHKGWTVAAWEVILLPLLSLLPLSSWTVAAWETILLPLLFSCLSYPGLFDEAGVSLFKAPENTETQSTLPLALPS